MYRKINTLLLASVISMSIFACRKPTDPTPSPSATPAPSNAPQDPLPSIAPDVPNAPQSTGGVELNILTFNCWGVPKVAGIYNVTKDQEERFNNISDIVNGYDIVNLQETFSENAQIIVDKANYQTKNRVDNSGFLKYNSGLTSFSKFALVKKDFFKFSMCSGADCYSNKGVSFMRLSVPNLGEIDLYNTHYQAIESKEDIRVNDNREFEMLLKKNDVGNPTIITGDFNFTNYDASDITSKAFTDFKRRFNPIDTFRAKNKTDVGFTSNSSINDYVDKKDKSQRLDYIFLLPENRGISDQKLNYKFEVVESKIVFNQPVKGKFLSDHFGINTKIRINVN